MTKNPNPADLRWCALWFTRAYHKAELVGGLLDSHAPYWPQEARTARSRRGRVSCDPDECSWAEVGKRLVVATFLSLLAVVLWRMFS